jgi:hypothetical protein
MISGAGRRIIVTLRVKLFNDRTISIAGAFIVVLAVMFAPLMAEGSAEGHPIKMLTDIDHDGNLDILSKDGEILLNDGNDRFLSNEIIFEDGAPTQRSYSLSNSTAVPGDCFNEYIDITYMTTNLAEEENYIMMITPGNETVTIFDGDCSVVEKLHSQSNNYSSSCS